MAHFKKMKVAQYLGMDGFLGQSFGSIVLITGFAGRTAIPGNFIIFAAAVINHLPDGWLLNWTGKKQWEGVEYFVLLLSIFLIITNT